MVPEASSNGEAPQVSKEEKVAAAKSPLRVEEGHSVAFNADDELLASLGYRSELRREFKYTTVFGQSFGAMGIASAIAESMLFSLGSAGAVGMVWSYLLGCLLLVPVAISLGELGSSMPTSGGLYYWVARLTPPKQRAFMCWLAGYMNVLGYISIFASTIYGATLVLVAAISIGSDQEWSSTKSENYGMYVATTLLVMAMTSVSSKTLSQLNAFYIFVQFAMLLCTIVALAATTPKESLNTASFVFGDFQNTGFWTSNGWAFMLSFLTPVWVVSGFESSATIAEEASNAAKAVPFAMISSLLMATVTGFAVIVTIAFTMGTDIDSIVGSSLGQPMAQIAFNSFGKHGSIAYLIFLWFASICNCSILLVAASRETFAFARDHGLPGSGYLRKLARNQAPIRAVGFCAVVTIIEGLLMLVNTTAINSIFNLAIIGLYFAYCMPLVSRVAFKHFTPGVFYTGDLCSTLCCYWSLGWMTFIFVLLLFPSYENPGPMEMNYAIVVLGFVVIFCVAYYFVPGFGGKTFFTGPVRTIDDIIDQHPELNATLDQKIRDDRNESSSGEAEIVNEKSMMT